MIQTIALIFTFHLPAMADNNCSVPVCDIPFQLEQLKNSSQSARWNYLSGLRKANAKVRDVAVLKNLKEFGQKAKELLVNLKEEDWLVREAANLHDDSVIKLCKADVPLLAEINENYGLLTGENGRYEVLHYWANQVLDSESRSLLETLTEFSFFAEKYSIQVEDEDWVIREAKSLRQAVTNRLSMIYPFHEGVYQIQGTGSAGDFYFDRMVVLHTYTDNGVIVSFVDSKTNATGYFFKNAVVSDGLRRLEATANNDSSIKRLEMELDAVSGRVTGRIIDARTLENLEFTGARSASLADSPSGILDPSCAGQLSHYPQGRYSGFLGTISGTYILKPIESNRLAGSFVSDHHGKLPIHVDFSGIYLKQSGSIGLVHRSLDGAFLKVSLNCREQGSSWEGIGISMNMSSGFAASFRGKP